MLCRMIHAIPLTLLIISIAATSFGQWADVTPTVLVDSRKAVGLAWGDYDDDGDLDLYVTRYGESNFLLRNDGLFNFTDVATPELADPRLSIGSTWSDYNDDGLVDLCWASDDGGGARIFQNVNHFLADLTQEPISGPYFDHSLSWLDYDNDGDLDLYIGGHEPNRLLRNDGALPFIEVTTGPLADPEITYAIAPGDYDDDGDLDLYLANDGPNRLLRNDGNGVFVDITSGDLGDGAWGRGAEWIDYDNDGDVDLYLTNDGATNRLFRNDGATLVDSTPPVLADAGGTKGMAWFDHDNDGDLDVYITSREFNRLFRNDGGGVFVEDTNTALVGFQEGEGTVWGDIDNDGDLDLVVAGLNAPSAIFRNDSANGNHWVRVHLSGNLSNRSGVGARLYLATPGGTQIREITAGTGWVSQNPNYAHFGLGSQATADSLTIRWPAGTVQIVRDVPIDTEFTIAEQPGVTATPPPLGSRAELVLHPAAPNPFNPRTRISFDLPREATVRLQVFDLMGRRVRTLIAGRSMAEGAHDTSWDGRDDGGNLLSSGVYVYRLEAGAWSASGEVSLVK